MKKLIYKALKFENTYESEYFKLDFINRDSYYYYHYWLNLKYKTKEGEPGLLAINRIYIRPNQYGEIYVNAEETAYHYGQPVLDYICDLEDIFPSQYDNAENMLEWLDASIDVGKYELYIDSL